MVDIHSHVIYGIDDGSRDFEESKIMLKMAEEAGTHIIVATSHFMPDAYSYVRETYNERLKEINDYLSKEKSKISVVPGNELYLDVTGLKGFFEGKCNTLNNSKYVLIEFSSMLRLDKVEEFLGDIESNGYKIVLAHTERVRYVNEDFNVIKRWYEKGYIFQINASSLVRKKHNKMYEPAHKLMKHGFVHAISSDGHRKDHRRPVLNEGYDYVNKLIGEEAANLLFNENPNNIIQDKDVKGLLDTKLNKNYTLKRLRMQMKGEF